MKVLKSKPISSFGGLNFVLEEFFKLKINKIFDRLLPKLPSQCQYSWHDIIFSYWPIFFCGWYCAEDLSENLKYSFINNPFINAPSPDRLLARLKDLSVPSVLYKKNRSEVLNEFSLNPRLNELNIKVLKEISAFNSDEIILDYDNTFIYTNKADSKRTYKKENGYCPGVGIIGDNVVYIENRNGNCAPHTMQDDTIERMFEILNSQNIKVDVFRADSASYQFSTISTIDKHVDRFYVKAKMKPNIYDAIKTIKDWEEVVVDDITMYRGSTVFTPFEQPARKAKKKELVKQYRLVVTKEPRKDQQINLFTGEACIYSPIITNDLKKTNDEIVCFYNQRGKQEREFDILKNDFAWNRLPFSKLEQNTVYLIFTAMCRNIYNYIGTFRSKQIID